MRLGFSCVWDVERSTTWSGTPWRLYHALAAANPTVDVGPHVGRVERLAWKATHLRRTEQGWRSGWKWSPVFAHRAALAIETAARRARCDVVVQVQDTARLSRPHIIYQDLSIDALLAVAAGQGLPDGFQPATVDDVLTRRAHQLSVYNSASAVCVMSEWVAQSLVERTGLDPAQVHVIRPGINVSIPEGRPRRVRESANRRRLLFVGRDFKRKGGPVLLDAVARVRRDLRADVELVVAGPKPSSLGLQPAGVRFVGPVNDQQVHELLADADLFVMPSAFEAFGIVFAEAAVSGVPFIAMNRFAGPEIARLTDTGVLVDATDPAALGCAILEALEDDGLHRRAEQGAGDAMRYWSWDRAAAELLGVAHASTGTR